MKRDIFTSGYNRCGESGWLSATLITIISSHFYHGNILEIQLVQQRSRHKSWPPPPPNKRWSTDQRAAVRLSLFYKFPESRGFDLQTTAIPWFISFISPPLCMPDNAWHHCIRIEHFKLPDRSEVVTRTPKHPSTRPTPTSLQAAWVSTRMMVCNVPPQPATPQ